MKKSLFTVLIMLFFATHVFAQSSSTSGNILFILDGSGSMWAQIDNTPKISIAKDVLSNLIQQLPENMAVGLEVYGHRNKGDCDDIELLSPLGSSNRATLAQQIQAIQPRGKTPITGAFKIAAEHLQTREDNTTVVLISDGKETCAGDPCVLIKDLKSQGIKVQVHVVGFDVNQDEREQLLCIAEAGGGQYFSAQNATELNSALTEVKQAVIQKAQTTSAEPAKEKHVITIRKPVIGSIDIKNLQNGSVYILDQQTGDALTSYCNDCGSNTQVPAGTYKLQFPNFTVEGIKIGPGENRIFDLNTVAGRLTITNLQNGGVQYYDQQTGEHRGSYCNDCGSNTQVPAGTYKLQFPNFTVEGVEIGPGENKIFDLNTVAGIIEIKNHQSGAVYFVDQQTGESRGSYCNDCGSNTQVPVGTYQLRFPNFTVENVVVEAGMTVVVE